MVQIRELDWNSATGKEVRVYRNLNNHRISVQTKQQGRWLVVGHVVNCVLSDVHFHISEKGRQRVIREATKNVHAYAQGKLLGQFDDAISTPINLAYNPYQNSSFVERSSQHPISNCQYLAVQDNRVFVSQDALILNQPIILPNLFDWLPQPFQWAVAA